MARATPVFHRLRVAEKRPDTDDSVVLTFAVPEALTDAYRHRHGQHLTLRAAPNGEEIRRSYSVCAPAGGPLRIGVRQVPDGAMSGWLAHDVAVGDEIEVMTPTGSFTCDTDATVARRHVAIAAGSGITPILSIVGTLLETEPNSTVSLLYVNRSHSSTMFVEELEALKNRHLQRLRITHLFTREPGPSALLSGRIDEARFDALVAAGVIDTTADTYFVCGPQAMAETVLGGLADHGVETERVRSELFGVPSPVRSATSAPSVIGAECTVVLNGRSSTVVVGPTDTVLDAALRNRSDVPYSCRAGACSTCRARLTSGAVAMDVCYGLEADEVDAGYVLTCQARPTTDAVTVDYDA